MSHVSIRVACAYGITGIGTSPSNIFGFLPGSMSLENSEAASELILISKSGGESTFESFIRARLGCLPNGAKLYHEWDHQLRPSPHKNYHPLVEFKLTPPVSRSQICISSLGSGTSEMKMEMSGRSFGAPFQQLSVTPSIAVKQQVCVSSLPYKNLQLSLARPISSSSSIKADKRPAKSKILNKEDDWSEHKVPSTKSGGTKAGAGVSVCDAGETDPEGISDTPRDEMDIELIKDPKKKRLARKAELARASRRRKKVYVKQLEDRVNILTARITELEAEGTSIGNDAKVYIPASINGRNERLDPKMIKALQV